MTTDAGSVEWIATTLAAISSTLPARASTASRWRAPIRARRSVASKVGLLSARPAS
jgi:hypothetical protein